MSTLRITPRIPNHAWAIQTSAGYDLILHAGAPHDLAKSDVTGEWLISLDVPRGELEAIFGGFGAMEFVATKEYLQAVDAAETTLARALEPKVKRETVKSYLAAVRAFMYAYTGVCPPDLKPSQAEAYLHCMTKTGVSAAKRNLAVNALQFFFQALKGETVRFVRPDTDPRTPNLLYEGQIPVLLRAAPTLRDRLLILLSYGSGLRVAELCALRPAHIDVDRGKVRVPGDGREVPLSDTLRTEWQEFCRHVCGEHWVFEGRDPAQPMEARSLQFAFRRICDLAGVGNEVTLQTLRHSHGVWLVGRHFTTHDIMERMGLQSANAVHTYRRWYRELHGGRTPHVPL
jgi:integrase